MCAQTVPNLTGFRLRKKGSAEEYLHYCDIKLNYEITICDISWKSMKLRKTLIDDLDRILDGGLPVNIT